MLYNTDAQTIAAGGTLTLPANFINSTGSITASGTTGVTLAPGQYLAQPLTVINSSGSSNTYTNSTLTVVKLA